MKQKIRSYTLSAAALAARRAAGARRSAQSPRREFATVRIERCLRDSAESVKRAGESLAAFVGEAVMRETARRG